MRKHNLILAASLMSLSAIASIAMAQTYKIADDTFIDSGSPGSPVPNGGVYPTDPNGTPAGPAIINGIDVYSYGADTKVKAVSSNYSSSYPFISFTHVLLDLPESFWNQINSNPSLLTTPGLSVTVNYYPVNDSMNVSDGHDNMELHPLTHNFTVGNGVQNKSPVLPVASTDGGATWESYDGNVTDLWTTPGGDYDAANFVLSNATDSTLPPSNGSIPFSWNITSLLQNPTTLAELEANGALIKVTNETQFPTNVTIPPGVNDFVSFNSANATNSAVLPTVVISVPEPGCVGMALLFMVGYNRRRFGSKQP